jgi:CDP-diacylglycerol--serine O-phosphatidyltransferase
LSLGRESFVMPDGLRTTVRGVIDRRVGASERTSVLASLTGADLLSLGALFLAWTSVLAFIRGAPNHALLLMFGGYALDKLDGAYARWRGVSSPFGRQIDSFIDVFVYLVTGALLFHYAVSPHPLVGAVVGFLILAFGGLRLVRHNAEGFGDESGTSYYHGTTVVHTNLVVVASYLLIYLLPLWNGWVAAVVVALACPPMVSDYRSYKTRASHALAGGAALLAAGLVVLIELGHL